MSTGGVTPFKLSVAVAIPTVVVGTSLLLLWGPIGLLGRWLDPYGIQPMFTPAGVLLAHLFVTFPYMVGAVKPVLRQAPYILAHAVATLVSSARSSQFWQITVHCSFGLSRGPWCGEVC